METSTRTQTSTHARLELLQWQFHALLARHCPEARCTEVYEQVVEPALARKVLKEIELLAKDRQGLCHAALTLAIDWQRHGREMQVARLVTLERPWSKRTSPQLKVMLDHFDKVVQKKRLRVSFRLLLSKDDELLAASKKARLVPVEANHWASPAEETDPVTILHLPELLLTCAIAKDWQD